MKKILLGLILAFSFIISYSQTASIDANNITARNRLRIPVKDTTGTAYCGELRMRMVSGDTALYIFNCRAVGKKRWDKYVTGFNVLDNRGNLDTLLVALTNDTIGIKSIGIISPLNLIVTKTVTDSTILYSIDLPNTITPVSGANFTINGTEYASDFSVSKVDSNNVDALKTMIQGAFALQSVQSVTSGVSSTISNNVIEVRINPASVLATHTLTTPPNPVEGQLIWVGAGGTISKGSPVVTAFTMAANSGQTLYDSYPPTLQGGDYILLRYVGTVWYRIRL